MPNQTNLFSCSNLAGQLPQKRYKKQINTAATLNLSSKKQNCPWDSKNLNPAGTLGFFRLCDRRRLFCVQSRLLKAELSTGARQRGSCSTYSSDWEDVCSREALQDVKQNILGKVQECQDSRPFYYPSLWRERKTSGTSTVNHWKRKKIQDTSVSDRTAHEKKVLHSITHVHRCSLKHLFFLQHRTLQTH